MVTDGCCCCNMCSIRSWLQTKHKCCIVVKAIQPLMGTWYIQTSDHTTAIYSNIKKNYNDIVKLYVFYVHWLKWNHIWFNKKRKRQNWRTKENDKLWLHFYCTKENMELCIAFYSNLNHIQERKKSKCNGITIIYLNNNRIYIT